MTISCRICQATYAPSQEHQYLLQAPPMALESAFMSMCHFCFRCRRPACPQCWDNVHGVCGECCVEANLPFRAQTAPLRGVLFATTRQAQLRRKHATPVRLVCIKPGRFQELTSVDTAETLPLQSAIQAHMIPPTARASRDSIASQTGEAGWEIERLPTRPPQGGFSTLPATHHQAARRRSDAVVRNHRQNLAIDEIATRPPRPRTTIALDQPEKQPPSKNDNKRGKKEGFALESLVTIVLLILLLAILALIATSLISSTANTTIEHFLHIDIRAELAYLWQLIRQLHP